ncbi:MAG: toll/interleukin-1 receptor domain-containing protein [Planctomycetota bacterium]
MRQYFDTDFARVLAVFETWGVHGPGNDVSVIARLHLDFDGNAKYGSCFVPACDNPGSRCRALLDQVDKLLRVDSGVRVQAGHVDLDESTDSRELRFTGRLFVYTETDIPCDERRSLTVLAATRGLALRIRGPAFAMARAKRERPMAFICHDSRDKDAVARPIAIGLSKLACTVWFDEYSLNVGDSLRQSIEKGLKECRKCVLVISPQFISNAGWTKVEFDTIFTREILEKKNFLLPVWYEVTKEAVSHYCPSLLNRLGIDWSLGEDEVVRRLRRAIIRSEDEPDAAADWGRM